MFYSSAFVFCFISIVLYSASIVFCVLLQHFFAAVFFQVSVYLTSQGHHTFSSFSP